MRKLLFLIPTLMFFGLVVLFVMQIDKDPRRLESVLINKPVPEFSLEALPGRGKPLASADLKGQVSLVNIFGSWCVACVAEHPYLVKIKQSGFVPIHGIDWREPNPEDGLRWLARNGDPYDRVGLDPDSRVAIDFGVTGAPETFVVDKNGVIRYKHIGIVDDKVWTETLKPMIEKLRSE